MGRYSASREKDSRIVSTVLHWYRGNGRSLPWRGTRDAYRILLSEVMLQQTQVSRVVVAYKAFLRKFPTLRSLARARQREVTVQWQGMGYNNRAVRLHRLAREITLSRRGRIPSTPDELLALPGIGRYTANALLCFAFNHDVPIVDINIRRVLSRIFWTMPSPSHLRAESEIWHKAAALLPPYKARAWNQALMDFGATVCTARRPGCSACPLRALCLSRPYMSRPPRHITRWEPGFHGVPNRLYRGRIVDELRHRRRGIPAYTLARKVAPQFTYRNAAWFSRILQSLQDDGLLRIRGNGTMRTTMVELA